MNSPNDPDEPDNVVTLPRTDPQHVPFEHTRQFQDMLAAAHEFLLNRVEDQNLDIASWSHDTVVKYAEVETAAFVQEWRIPVNETEVHKVARALVKELDRKSVV